MPKINLTALSVVVFRLGMWSVSAAGAYRLTHHGEPGLRHAIFKRVDVAVVKIRHIKHRVEDQTFRLQG